MPTMRNLRDERGVVVNWLVKIVVVLAIVGVAIFDAGSIAVNFFGLDSAADEIAVILSTEIGSGSLSQSNSPQLLARAEELASERDARLKEVTFGTNGVVHVSLKRKAKTLVVGRIGPIKDWTRATAEGQSGTT